MNQKGVYVMEKSRRKNQFPVPKNLTDYLTREQLKALPELRKKGVTLFAVRRPLFQEPAVIVELLAKNRYGVLLKDGGVDYFPDIKIREQLPDIKFRYAS